MKVILQKDIPNLGDAGDVKDVSPGYARNFLLPKKLVLVANESSQRAIEHQNKLIKIKKDKRKKQSEKLIESLSGVSVTISAQVGEEGKLFGSVTSIDIARKLKEIGHEIDKRKIQLADPIKQVGEYEVTLKLEEGLNATVKVIVEQAV
ncbi:MAG TPA: 50S ribosomal protein L9 [Spirochaetota bacterium]|nr:50S ribosomal protein L9 [Spirochaetota bacterium]HNT09572.1 50S ribosomal protein L9 [Spirochaetota bacterium]HNV45616.1 50S ribosomal protein L9 [Spirochaetota bacterium]HOS38951.1 50S ribosomal protein L9 [Spirochaetota bacterium]HPI22552.1 50S ribosomal protein L9 [Spirochaetota bacterium]